jgi:alpha-galactosidase
MLQQTLLKQELRIFSILLLIIQEQGISIYRQDFNIEPFVFWLDNDTSDRIGISENHYVQGYLAFWDDLLQRNPGLLIDTCASGGRRLDLETLRRSVPLWRSDFGFQPEATQRQTYGLSMWLPYHGHGTAQVSTYDFRSNMCPAVVSCWDLRNKQLDYALLRRLTKQWRDVAPNYLGDYYPLTPYTAGDSVWIAWQFNRPEAGEGMMQAFRRPQNAEASMILKLRGLEAKKNYRITNLDTDISKVMDGRELMDQGLNITISEKPGTALFSYRVAQ